MINFLVTTSKYGWIIILIFDKHYIYQRLKLIGIALQKIIKIFQQKPKNKKKKLLLPC